MLQNKLVIPLCMGVPQHTFVLYVASTQKLHCEIKCIVTKTKLPLLLTFIASHRKLINNFMYFTICLPMYYSILPTSINDELFSLFVGNRSMDEIIGSKKD